MFYVIWFGQEKSVSDIHVLVLSCFSVPFLEKFVDVMKSGHISVWSLFHSIIEK